MPNSIISTNRPLSIVSDFVAEELPLILSTIDCEESQFVLSNKTENLIQEIENQPISDNVISLLDLTFLEAAFYANKLEIPQNLISLTNTYANHFCLPAMLTYELIILVNPSQDLRLFSSQVTGEHERLFYESHKQVEANLYPLVTFLLGIVVENQFLSTP